MANKLSIIIPCYNCEYTLCEAVESCYTQELSEDEFEIIMVDDGSSDNTRQVMESEVRKHSNINLLFHSENRGGGAARNTGIQAAKNEIIYCLDSDNFFAAQSVKPMLNYLVDNNLDGVAFYERRFFSEDDFQKFSSRYNSILDRYIQIEDLFSEPNIMLDNFFYTKSAYQKTNTYPEHHGFDTQTFEIDFLARELKVKVCPDSIFYHRQNQAGHKSYYEREYERGLISINTYLALEPIIHTLNSDVIEMMIFFDIYQKNFHGNGTHLRGSVAQYVQSGKSLLINSVQTRSIISEQYVTMCTHLKNKEYESAQETLRHCTEMAKQETPLLHYMQLRISYGLAGSEKQEIDQKAAEFLTSENMLHKPKYTRTPKILKPLHQLYLHIFNK